MHTNHSHHLLVCAPLALVLSACASLWEPAPETPAAAAKTPPVQAAISLGNEDYYEAHADGRLHVFDDFQTYQDFLKLGESPYRLTRIGAGPQGQTVVFGLTPADKAKRSGIAAIDLFDGKLQGAESGFYAEVFQDERFHVFSSWADLQAFRRSGEAALRYTDIGAGPQGRTVVYVLSAQNKQQRPDALIQQFRTRHG